VARCRAAAGVRDGYLRGALASTATQRQVDVLAAFVVAGGSVQVALIYAGRASGRLVVPSLELEGPDPSRSA
jgi:hypothetical protein